MTKFEKFFVCMVAAILTISTTLIAGILLS